MPKLKEKAKEFESEWQSIVRNIESIQRILKRIEGFHSRTSHERLIVVECHGRMAILNSQIPQTEPASMGLGHWVEINDTCEFILTARATFMVERVIVYGTGVITSIGHNDNEKLGQKGMVKTATLHGVLRVNEQLRIQVKCIGDEP